MVKHEITVLEGVNAVRKVAGMYIGSVNDGSGYFNMFREAIDNSIDEFLAGRCDKISVVLYKDGSISVQDNGAGIPVYHMKEQNMNSLEVVFSTLHAGGKFNKNAYSISSGLHGVGVSVTNFLSKKLKVVVQRDGKEYSMAFEKGCKTKNLEEKSIKSKKTGTFVRFMPDHTIFKNITKFDPEQIKTKLKELSYLCSGLTIDFVDEKKKEKVLFPNENGIIDFVKDLAPSKLILDPILISDKEEIAVDIALQWADNGSDSEMCRYYTNNVYNIDGGSHMIGFKSGLTRTINSFVQKSDLPRTLKLSLTGDDVREGLVAVISIRHPDPKFSSQTKDKLVSEDARTAVENAISTQFMNFLEQNPTDAKKIVTRCVNARKAREAAKKAREAVRKAVLTDTTGILPGKLADCSSKNPDECELFLVEGNSAGGCFSASTKVMLCDGRELSMLQLLKEEENGIQNHCYTINRHGDIDIALVQHVRKTKSGAKVIKIMLDNDHEEICTPDHKLMLRNGTYVEARDSLDKSLMHLYTRISGKKVVEIIEIEETMDVYDLEVPETHNFALASGIFVHNSAKMGRDRKFQAILPLRGKVLNVEKTEFRRILGNEELISITTALGIGMGKHLNINKLRYKKIVIFCDADVDGSHIRTLLLTFFFRQMPQLITNGNLYIAQPPLYRINVRGNAKYLKSDKELQQFVKNRKLNQSKLKIQRFKGLGEMDPQQLWDTSMNPETREMLQVTIGNYVEADRIFGILMGNQVDPRREFIELNSSNVVNLDT